MLRAPPRQAPALQSYETVPWNPHTSEAPKHTMEEGLSARGYAMGGLPALQGVAQVLPGDPHTPPAFPAPPLPSLSPHLRPPVPRWAPPCGNCPWRRGQRSRPRVRNDLEGCGGSAAPAAPSLSRLPQPRPPAPLCGRSPAGSVAAEAGPACRKRREPARPQSARFIPGASAP